MKKENTSNLKKGRFTKKENEFRAYTLRTLHYAINTREELEGAKQAFFDNYKIGFLERCAKAYPEKDFSGVEFDLCMFNFNEL